MNNILIYGQSYDLHLDSVTYFLEKKNVNVILFDRNKTGHTIDVSFKSGKFQVLLNIDNTHYHLRKDIQGIFWRPKPSSKADNLDKSCTREEYFLAYELINQSMGLDYLKIEDCKFINSINMEQKMNNKIYQLHLAMLCDLVIPSTMISNNFHSIEKFFSYTDTIIYKHLSFLTTEEGKPCTTKILNAKDFSTTENTIIKKTPLIYQNFIRKAYELRIIIVHTKVFPVRIDYSENSQNKIDWRSSDSQINFSIGYLDPEVQKNLLRFHEKSGLVYAAYDFIVDIHGTYIFLECNPAGNWMFVGEEIGNIISSAIADYLASDNSYFAN